MVQVLFAAGGTGGHLFPALEIAEELTASGVECSFAALGLSQSSFFPHGKWPSFDIPALRPSLNPLKALSFLWTTASSTRTSFHLLGTLKPRLVIGFGSYHTVPVLSAAVLKRLPLFLFEPNASPGQVIRLFSHYATLTGICFERTKGELHSPTELVSMPLLRSSIIPVERKLALNRYGFSGDSPIVVAFGGSQGSSVINQMVIKALHLFDRQKRPHLLLLCGQGQDKEVLEKMAQNLGVMARIVPFEKEMSYAYSVGDLFVSRSGASTVAEIAAFGKPAICIPYPFAKEDHQRMNAEELVKSGKTLIIEEVNLTPDRLCTDLFRLLQMMGNKSLNPSVIEAPSKKQFSQVILDWIQKEKVLNG
jgi:UDP-N-acetylglucosamine--N-acetylmuramyl-(pentapeptide) pyrophosphoryl-undecaprenol N-acetylglucosamine transferase